MSSLTRSTRRSIANPSPTQPQADMGVLTNLDRLILAQAVYEFGANSWSAVAKLLKKHPLLQHPKSFFTPQSCHAMYHQLMKEAELEYTESNNAIRAASNLKLAQRHYQARVHELRELITIEETKFKRIISEIDEARSGLLDDRIKEKIGGVLPGRGTSETSRSPINSNTVDTEVQEIPQADELFGSDLSGVTDTGSPPSQSREEALKDQEPILVSDAIPNNKQDFENSVDLSEQKRGTLEHQDSSTSSLAIGADILPFPVANEPSLHSVERPDSKDEVSTALSVGTATPEPLRAEEAFDDEGRISGDGQLHSARRITRGRRSSIPNANASHTRGNKHRRNFSGLSRNSVEISMLRQQQRPFEDGELETDRTAMMKDDDHTQTERSTDEGDHETTPFRRRESKRKTSFAEGTEWTRDKKRVREQSEQADEDEAGLGSRRRERQVSTGDHVTFKKFQTVISLIHSQISQHRNGNIFHNPIKHSEAPDYHEIVKRPMDLKTIKARVKDGVIANSADFQRDVFLMFANAMMYNRPGSDIYHMAEDMMLESESQINTYRTTEVTHRS